MGIYDHLINQHLKKINPRYILEGLFLSGVAVVTAGFLVCAELDELDAEVDTAIFQARQESREIDRETCRFNASHSNFLEQLKIELNSEYKSALNYSNNVQTTGSLEAVTETFKNF